MQGVISARFFNHKAIVRIFELVCTPTPPTARALRDPLGGGRPLLVSQADLSLKNISDKGEHTIHSRGPINHELSD